MCSGAEQKTKKKKKKKGKTRLVDNPDNKRTHKTPKKTKQETSKSGSKLLESEKMAESGEEAVICEDEETSVGVQPGK